MLDFIVDYGFMIWLGVMGLITMLAYGFDKRAAIRRARRIPEKTLFALNLAGGFLGGWIGMYAFRHKTRHKSFYIAQTLSTIVWLTVWGALIWLKNE